MATNKFYRLVILVGLLATLAYFLLNKDFVIQEHLTQGKPTLLTLQNDAKTLDTRLSSLQTDFDKFKEQAKQGADAAASARAQINATKYSSPTSPP